MKRLFSQPATSLASMAVNQNEVIVNKGKYIFSRSQGFTLLYLVSKKTILISLTPI